MIDIGFHRPRTKPSLMDSDPTYSAFRKLEHTVGESFAALYEDLLPLDSEKRFVVKGQVYTSCGTGTSYGLHVVNEWGHPGIIAIEYFQEASMAQ